MSHHLCHDLCCLIDNDGHMCHDSSCKVDRPPVPMSAIPLSEALHIAAESSMLNAAIGATTTSVDNLARQAHLFEAAAQVCKAAEDASRETSRSPSFQLFDDAFYKAVPVVLADALDAAVQAGKGK